MIVLQYEIIVYWSEQDNFYVAEVPELPGCITDGPSYQEALANAETAIQEWIDTAKSLGKEVPEPKKNVIDAE
jgi:predicted RNase H-like HicB family nuclease